jgi:hypothetical protein
MHLPLATYHGILKKKTFETIKIKNVPVLNWL